MKTRYDEMRKQAEEFHRQNPHVWVLFQRFTLQMVDRGFKHYGAMGIFQRIRWHTDTPDEHGRSTFKINNNHFPFYARAFMRKYPQHEGFFRLREQGSKYQPATGLPPLGPEDYPEARA